jgi:superfamily II DNA or RNA helicase
MLKLINPTQVRLIGYEDKIDQVKENLSYRDLKFSFELKRLKDSSKFFIANHGIDSYQDEVERISSQIKQCLLFQDQSGYWTYSGLASKLALDYNDTVINEIKYPEPELISWAKDPKPSRKYQEEIKSALLKVNHGSVEVSTGLGKSWIALNLIKELGLKTLVMAPSINIANQLYADCCAFFGKHKVGAYFSNKKDSSKLITVGVAAGLTRIDESDSSWINLRDCQIFIADESHMCPAKTLAKVCFGLMAKAPYRFFFSGTQLRNDGSDLLLQAITGPIVYSMDLKEGVDQGYLAKPIFNMVKTQTNLLYSSKDVNKLTRRHLFYNPEVNQRAGQIANQAWSVGKRPTLILIEEIEQFNHILPFLRYPVKFAHGPLDSAGKAKIPKEYHSKDTNKLVKEFNEGKFPILIGTSCVATGTDFLTVENIIYLRGGTSEIEVRQGLGRGTRMPEGSSKKDCYFWDFDVTNEEALHRHAKVRAKIYNEVYPGLKEVTING